MEGRPLTNDNHRGTAFLGVKYAAANMQSLGKGGSIIITASLASEAAHPEMCAYSMSKFAVRALSVTAAQEYAKDKIRVNTVSPGLVNTPLVKAFTDLEERLRASPAGKYPMIVLLLDLDWAQDPGTRYNLIWRTLADFGAGRAVEPSEVAKLYLFLASDDAVMVSGSNYRMDGGMLQH